MKLCTTAALLTLTVASSATAHTCWIDSVTTYKNGVSVKFEADSPPFFNVIRASQPSIYTEYRRYNGLYYKITDDNGELDPDKYFGDLPSEIGDDGIRLYLGDILLTRNTPEDTCYLTVIEKEGQIGAQIGTSYYNNIPGASVDQRSEFIPRQ